jgi:hypothetical protein
LISYVPNNTGAYPGKKSYLCEVEVFLAVTMKNEVVFIVTPFDSSQNRDSVKHSAYIIRVIRSGELRTSAITSNRSTPRRNTIHIVSLMMEAITSSETPALTTDIAIS